MTPLGRRFYLPILRLCWIQPSLQLGFSLLCSSLYYAIIVCSAGSFGTQAMHVCWEHQQHGALPVSSVFELSKGADCTGRKKPGLCTPWDQSIEGQKFGSRLFPRKLQWSSSCFEEWQCCDLWEPPNSPVSLLFFLLHNALCAGQPSLWTMISS